MPSDPDSTVYQVHRGADGWECSKVQTCDSPKAALAKAMEQNLMHTNAIQLWNGRKQALADFLHVFTTDDSYLSARRFFVGLPPMKKLSHVIV
jgi:hypothetical protein